MKYRDMDKKHWVLAWNEGSAVWVDPINENDLQNGYTGRTTWDCEKAHLYSRYEVEAVIDILQRNGHHAYAYTVEGYKHEIGYDPKGKING